MGHTVIIVLDGSKKFFIAKSLKTLTPIVFDVSLAPDFSCSLEGGEVMKREAPLQPHTTRPSCSKGATACFFLQGAGANS